MKLFTVLNEQSKSLLTEGVETKNMKAAKHFLYDKMGYNEEQAMWCIGQIKTDIPNSRLGKCKFMLAMVRMYANGEFKDGQTIMNVNKSLKYAASDSHINEYNQDLNGLTSEQFIAKFSGVAQEDLEQDKNDVSAQQYDTNNSQYQIVRIDSFEQSEEYGEYVSWCVTQDESMYNSYTSNGQGVFYFCLRNGWEDEEEVRGENCPLDSYGLSMIAVSINSDGSCNTITCRWNHDNGGNDHIMSPKQLSQVINMNFYNVFRPLTPQEIEKRKQEKLSLIRDEIESLSQYSDIGDFCNELPCDKEIGDVDERTVYAYESTKGYVLLDEFCDLIVDEIFTDVLYRAADLIEVNIGNKFNFITLDGKYVSEIWFDQAAANFREGVAFVRKGEKWNIINKQGQFLLPQWVDALHAIDIKAGIIEILDSSKIFIYDLTTSKYIFNKPIQDYRKMEQTSSPYEDADTNSLIYFVKFEGEDFYQLYNIKSGKLFAPYKISAIMGRHFDNPYIELVGNKQGYLMDKKGDLYFYKRHQQGNFTCQLAQQNPFNMQQANESRKRTLVITEKQMNNIKKSFIF